MKKVLFISVLAVIMASCCKSTKCENAVNTDSVTVVDSDSVAIDTTQIDTVTK